MITRSKEPPTPPATPPTKAALSEESGEVPITKGKGKYMLVNLRVSTYVYVVRFRQEDSMIYFRTTGNSVDS